MEIPIINRIRHFEPSFNSLQNPSFLSQIFSVSGVERVFLAYNFWKWGAVIIAIVASFGSIITSIKILFFRFKLRANSLASEPFLKTIEDEDYSDDDSDDDDTVSCSSYSSSSEFEEDMEPNSSSSTQNSDWFSDNEYFQVKGSSSDHYFNDKRKNRNSGLLKRRNSTDYRRFSWSDLTSSMSVVKLWDSLGLSLDFNDETERVTCVYDMEKDKKVYSNFSGKWRVPIIADLSPSAILSAEMSESGIMSLAVRDPRMGSHFPSILTEWGPKQGNIVELSSDGTRKVVIRDDNMGSSMVGDLRKVSSPLKEVDEAETWWDTDAVIVSDDYVEKS